MLVLVWCSFFPLSHHFRATAEANIIKPDFILFSCCKRWFYSWGFFPIIKRQSCRTIYNTVKSGKALIIYCTYQGSLGTLIVKLIGTTESSKANLWVIWPVLLILLLLHTIKPSFCTLRDFYLFSNTAVIVQK